MRTILRACLAVALALTAVGVLAEPILLEYKFAPGDVDKYKLTIDMSFAMPGMPAKAGKSSMKMSVSMPYTQRVLEVYEDGSARIKTTYGAPTITGFPVAAKNFRKAAARASEMSVMTMSKRGELLSFDRMDKMAGSPLLKGVDFDALLNCASGQALLPEEPVEVGQTWDQSISLPLGNSWMGVSSTLVSSDEVIGDRRVARIRQNLMGGIDMASLFKAIVSQVDTRGKMLFDISSMVGDLNLDGSMTYLFAPAIGKLMKGSGNVRAGMDISMPPELVKQGAPQTLAIRASLAMNISRVK